MLGSLSTRRNNNRNTELPVCSVKPMNQCSFMCYLVSLALVLQNHHHTVSADTEFHTLSPLGETPNPRPWHCSLQPVQPPPSDQRASSETDPVKRTFELILS
jgi:hypothetical protein